MLELGTGGNNMNEYTISLINFIRIIIIGGIPAIVFAFTMAKLHIGEEKLNKWDIIKIIISLFLVHDFIFFVTK
jgi:hypothetical protein